ncbi:MAG TPA: Hsp20/alpha crystallin family protein [Candidatus Eisenbacteria bacterium]|nr:Hsp20/alpha crystallin family protein [Candidatus Eisenbacteria bacterium]
MGITERDRIRTDSKSVEPARDREMEVREAREGTVPTERSMDVERRGAAAPYSGDRDPWLASHFDFMRHFMREMSRMFEGFPGGGGGRSYSTTSWPPIEMLERDGHVVVRAEMPGMRREDVRVRVEDQSLVIEGERRDDREARHEGYFESEWSYGRFARRVRLPDQVDPDRVKARYDNGILEVTLDLPPRARREVPIIGADGGLRGAVEARNRESTGSRP